MLKDYQGALEDLNKADVLEPNHAFTLKNRGEVKQMLEDYQGALKDLDKVDVLQPNDAFTLRRRGDVKRMLEDYQGALKDLNKADVLEPNNAFTLGIRGDAKKMLEDYQGALKDLDKADVLQPNDAFTLRRRGDVKRMLEDHQGALEDLNKADVLEPNNAFTLGIRGDAKKMLEDYQGALKDLDKADVFQPNDAFTLRRRGDVKRMLEDYQRALEDLNKADVLEPNDTFTLIIHAYTNWSLNNYQIALETMEKVHVLDPNNHLILQTQNWLKWMLTEYQPMIESLQCNSNIPFFAYDELNFGKLLGKGLFGEVYESRWKGIKIAVKVLYWNGFYNEGAKKSFTSEMCTLRLIQHINLVRLLGYCIQGPDHMLVYEYMSNKSLDKWLFRDKLLNWNKQVSIIIGVAHGLAYLHHTCNPTIIHLDIKPGNILLDKDYTPKLADFGLAKILKGSNENEVCAFPFFSLINYMHTHYIYTNIDSSFETFVTKNKFKNKLKLPIGIVLPLMWIL
jgi:tetratricopeptide (TPR) repeat protein